MSRFESPGQLVLLFVGAALFSVVLVALLSAAAREPERDKGAEFPVPGRRTTSDQPPVARSRRSLQDEDHPVRHRGAKHSRVHRNSTPAPPPHDSCYGTHEVLFIIALTCAVNFAFIFVVMAMVHMCNRNGSSSSSCKSTGLTGLDSLDVPEECLATGRLITRSASCNGVQEYINNLPPVRTASTSSVAQLQASYSMEDLLYAG